MKIIWFSEIKWDYMVTRKQQIISRFPENWKILFIEPYVVGKSQHWLPKRYGNLIVLTIPFLKSIPQPRLARIFESSLIRMSFGMFGRMYFSIISVLLGFRGSDRIIGLSSAYWGKIAASQKARLHFYDANDAHLDFPGTPAWLEDYLKTYLSVADLCFSVSPEISKKIERLGAKHIHLLGNGVDFDHFSTPQAKPDQLKTISRPILGYAGAMDWLDAELIRKLCLAHPGYDVILIGPEISPGWYASQAAFENLSNLHYLGKVSYQSLPAYVQAFDIALIPFVVDELTRPLNPNKLYEYSAAGKPVISMNYSSTIQSLSEIIYVANNHDEFVALVDVAYKRPTDSKRLELARKHSWDNISQEMARTILEDGDSRG